VFARHNQQPVFCVFKKRSVEVGKNALHKLEKRENIEIELALSISHFPFLVHGKLAFPEVDDYDVLWSFNLKALQKAQPGEDETWFKVLKSNKSSYCHSSPVT